MLAEQPTRGFSVGLAALLEDLGAEDRPGAAGAPSDLARTARLVGEVALGRARAGQLEQACALAERAERLYRQLATADRRARYLPELATTLTAHGLWASRLGRRRQAVALLSEAVELHRELLERAGAGRPMHRLRLRVGHAVALSNLGSARSQLGEHVAATEEAERAVRLLRELHRTSRLYRLLAWHDPLGFQRCLAGALNNLGVVLAERGHRARAWELAEQTTELYRELAGRAPVLFEPELARALHNLGTTAAEVGRTEVALSATREAVRLHRVALGDEPDEYRQHLGRALCSFARVRATCGVELGEALTAAEEAVTLHEGLTERRPGAFSADLHVAYRTATSVRDALARRDGSGGAPAPH